MRLSLCTDCLGDLPFERMLDKASELGVRGVEMTAGGGPSPPHLRADELLAAAGKRRAVLGALEGRGLEIAALNVSGNPLDPGELGARHRADTEDPRAGGPPGCQEDRDDERPAAGKSRGPRPELDHLHRQLAGDAEGPP